MQGTLLFEISLCRGLVLAAPSELRVALDRIYDEMAVRMTALAS